MDVKIGQIIPIAGGAALALAGSALQNRSLKYGVMAAGGVVAAYGLYKVADLNMKQAQLDKASGNDPAVAQAQRLHDALYDWSVLGFSLNVNEEELQRVANEITCWDKVKQYYTQLTRQRVESALQVLSAEQRRAFTNALERGGKHLQCNKLVAPGTPGATSPARFANTPYLTTTGTVNVRWAPRVATSTLIPASPAELLKTIPTPMRLPSGTFVGVAIREAYDAASNTYFTLVRRRTKEGQFVYFWIANQFLSGQSNAPTGVVKDISATDFKWLASYSNKVER